jgi:16S rRNA (guanine527-N7)-methyltransferase
MSYHAQGSADDTEALLPVVDLLGGEITDLQSWQTPLTQSDRHCLFIHKDRPTPSDFPRAVGIPAKHPLR